MKNTFLEKLKRGEKPLGSFSELCSPYSIECMALSGLDYVILDMEHGPAELHDVSEGIKAAALRGMTPFVRISSLDRDAVLRPLDLGAMGLIAPCVQGLEDVKKLIEYSKYLPDGQRGLAFGRSSGWGTEPWAGELEGYFAACNENQLLIPQCETLGCLSELDKIVALPQVAGIFIGPFDLSVAMGIPGQFEREEFKATLSKIKDCCHNHGKFCMIYATSAENAAKQLCDGMDSVTVNMDAILYINMYRQLIRDVRDLAEKEE